MNSLMGMSLSFAYGKSNNPGYGFSASVPLSLNFAYTKAYVYATSPAISDKVLADNKEWGNSTEAYWNAQEPSNRDIWASDVLPLPDFYAVGFALKQALFSPLRYVYHVVVKTGNNVSWKITNNDALSATVYCKVGSGTYQSYGTLASGATSLTFTRTITDGLTTIYAYVVAGTKAPSYIASL